MTLLDIVGEFNELYELAKSEETLDEQVFNDTLEALSFELADKVDAYATVMFRLETEEKQADELSRKYKERRDRIRVARKKMADKVLYACDSLGVDHIDGEDVTLKVRKNGGVQPLVIDDPEAVPSNLTKITIEPDNAKIRDYLADHEVPWAHLEERGRSVKIV